MTIWVPYCSLFSTLCFLALAYLHNSPAIMKVEQDISESTIFKGKLKLVYESTKMKLDLVLEVAYEQPLVKQSACWTSLVVRSPVGAIVKHLTVVRIRKETIPSSMN